MYPNIIILDSRDTILYLRSMINNLLEFNANEDQVLSVLFEAIVNEDNAELNLHYECLAIMQDAVGEVYELDIERIIEAMVKFGTILYFELKQIKAYNNGILNYKYNGMLGSDIMLVRRNKGICNGI